MTLEANELFGPSATSNGHLRAAPYDNGVITGKLAIVSGAPILARLTPMSFNESTQQWQVWSAAPATGVNEVQTYNLGAPTAGTYTLNFDGQTTSALAFNASAATITTALDALSNLAPGDAIATGGPSNSAAVVVTFGGAYANMNVPAVVIDPAGLTGGNGSTVATITTEGDSGSGIGAVAGFLWEDDFQSSATGEKLCNILIHGLVDRNDVPLPSGEAQADLDEALRDGPRALGLDIQGLTGVH